MKGTFMFLVILIVILPLGVTSAELFELPDVTRPSMFIVDHNRVYILEEATVYIYSLKDFKLIKKFGRAGEGPKEFKYDPNDGRPLSMSFFKGQLIVNSTNKMSFFDKDGNYIKENKVTVDRLLFPVNGKFLGIGPTAGEKNRQYIGFTIYKNNYKSANVIFLSDFEMNNPTKLILPITSFTYNPVYKNRIYINSNSDDFKIIVFDDNGKREYVIEKDYPKVKIPGNFRESALEFFRTNPRFKNAFEYIKKVFQIRENFPPIRDIQVTSDRIYVLTFKREGDLWECLKLDLKGNEKGRIFIKLNAYEHFTFYPIFYSVYKDKVYSLVEDEDEEVWKIYVTDFK